MVCISLIVPRLFESIGNLRISGIKLVIKSRLVPSLSISMFLLNDGQMQG